MMKKKKRKKKKKLGHMNMSTRFLLHLSPYLCQIIYTTTIGKIYFTCQHITKYFQNHGK